MDKFKHVVGIIHTNYLSYTRSYTGGAFKEPLLYYVNQGMCRAYCHKIIKLSGMCGKLDMWDESTFVGCTFARVNNDIVTCCRGIARVCE